MKLRHVNEVRSLGWIIWFVVVDKTDICWPVDSGFSGILKATVSDRQQ